MEKPARSCSPALGMRIRQARSDRLGFLLLGDIWVQGWASVELSAAGHEWGGSRGLGRRGSRIHGGDSVRRPISERLLRSPMVVLTPPGCCSCDGVKVVSEVAIGSGDTSRHGWHKRLNPFARLQPDEYPRTPPNVLRII
jgi:hypothetical protein